MTTLRNQKESVWKSFSSQFDELGQLHAELQTIEARRQQIEEKIAAKKRIIAEATGVSWETIESTGVVAGAESLTAALDNGEPARVEDTGERSTKVAHKSSVRWWVLRAIAHYEDENPQSRVDANSIRIFINSAAPSFLDGLNPNIISSVLHNLKTERCIAVKPRDPLSRRGSQYCLDTKGRLELTTPSATSTH